MNYKENQSSVKCHIYLTIYRALVFSIWTPPECKEMLLYILTCTSHDQAQGILYHGLGPAAETAAFKSFHSGEFGLEIDCKERYPKDLLKYPKFQDILVQRPHLMLVVWQISHLVHKHIPLWKQKGLHKLCILGSLAFDGFKRNSSEPLGQSRNCTHENKFGIEILFVERQVTGAACCMCSTPGSGLDSLCSRGEGGPGKVRRSLQTSGASKLSVQKGTILKVLTYMCRKC